MHKMKQLFIILTMLFTTAKSQEFTSDSVIISKIYNEALTNGDAYSNLKNLCKDVGHRLSGSKGAEKAVQWAYLGDRVSKNRLNVILSYMSGRFAFLGN